MKKDGDRYVMVQENAVCLMWDAVDLQDKTLIWLLRMMLYHCDGKIQSRTLSQPEGPTKES